MIITPKQLAEWKRLSDPKTLRCFGCGECVGFPHGDYCQGPVPIGAGTYLQNIGPTGADKDTLAAAVPALIEEVERLRAIVGAAKGWRETRLADCSGSIFHEQASADVVMLGAILLGEGPKT